MAKVIWTEPALQDLDRIADYISLDKPDAAQSLVKRVIQRVGRLAEFPQLGSHPRDLQGEMYRHLVIPPLRVFYRIDSDFIYIILVMRGERRLDSDLFLNRD